MDRCSILRATIAGIHRGQTSEAFFVFFFSGIFSLMLSGNMGKDA